MGGHVSKEDVAAFAITTAFPAQAVRYLRSLPKEILALAVIGLHFEEDPHAPPNFVEQLPLARLYRPVLSLANIAHLGLQFTHHVTLPMVVDGHGVFRDERTGVLTVVLDYCRVDERLLLGILPDQLMHVIVRTPTTLLATQKRFIKQCGQHGQISASHGGRHFPATALAEDR